MDANKMVTPNSHIGCTVKECKYHSPNENFCTLDRIMVTKHHDATTVECTDCGSFELQGK
jgi:hypothetical protein